jgi:hypothetical protein
MDMYLYKLQVVAAADSAMSHVAYRQPQGYRFWFPSDLSAAGE